MHFKNVTALQWLGVFREHPMSRIVDWIADCDRKYKKRAKKTRAWNSSTFSDKYFPRKVPPALRDQEVCCLARIIIRHCFIVTRKPLLTAWSFYIPPVLPWFAHIHVHGRIVHCKLTVLNDVRSPRFLLRKSDSFSSSSHAMQLMPESLPGGPEDEGWNSRSWSEGLPAHLRHRYSRWV